MKKFVRIISPITLAIVLALDIAVVGFFVYAIQRIIEEASFITIAFIAIDIFALIIAIFTTKEALSNGVIFYDDRIEFTGLDTGNTFYYNDIIKIETQKDTKASLRKNFVDRYSHIILHLNNDTVATIDLGLTTTKTLKRIETELTNRTKE